MPVVPQKLLDSVSVDPLAEAFDLLFILASAQLLYVILRVGIRLLELDRTSFGDRHWTAFWITVIATAAECGVLAFAHHTIVSSIIGLMLIFVLTHMPEEEHGDP